MKRRRTAAKEDRPQEKSPRLPGVSSFADAVPYPLGHPLASSAFDLSWKNPTYQPTTSSSSTTSSSTSSSSSTASSSQISDKHAKIAKAVRVAGDLTWVDASLSDWDPNDYRLFVSNIGPEVTTDMLADKFNCYPSLLKAHVVMDKKTGRSKGFGFVSFREASDYLLAFRELNGKFLGSRALHLQKSTWKERDPEFAREKEEKKPIWLR